jgi:APA family basic amino acid/polyamine antiporter
MASVVMISQQPRTPAAVFNLRDPVDLPVINLYMLLRADMPDAKRSFTVPLYPLPPILGVLSCVGLMIFLNLEALVIAAIWIAVGYLIYRRSRRSREARGKASGPSGR